MDWAEQAQWVNAMANRSRNIRDSVALNEHDRIHKKLLGEAVKGLADLKSERTLNLSQIKARVRTNKLSTDQRLSKALKPLKGP
jgi:hypothetical protein